MTDFHFVIFGGTGDLTKRKLLPAFYDLAADNHLPENFKIVALGRRFSTEQEYLTYIHKHLQQEVRFNFEEEVWQKIKQKIVYLQMDITEEGGYRRLKKILAGSNSLRIFYLALAPQFFEPVVERLEAHGLVETPAQNSRLVIEKPFGRNFTTAKKLNQKIRQVFPEKNIYRIDHYLGKEMLQNVLVIRFANIFFEPVWNKKFIDNVQIISTEKGGIGRRGAYYDSAGAIRDMVQNHMFQLLTLTAMEPPATMDAESIRSEKVKILKSLQEINQENLAQRVVLGQYSSGNIDGDEVPGYHQEEGVDPDSRTETFVALKLFIDSLRWEGVPFYLKTGKRLSRKLTQIVVEFKDDYHPFYKQEFTGLDPDLLVIRIQPREGVFFQFNAKEPGPEQKIVPVRMDFCQNCVSGEKTPGAYERLIRDLFTGDSTLFTRWDEVEQAWKFVDQIISSWQEQKPDFPNYVAGASGPAKADKLLQADGRKWWKVEIESGRDVCEND